MILEYHHLFLLEVDFSFYKSSIKQDQGTGVNFLALSNDANSMIVPRDYLLKILGRGQDRSCLQKNVIQIKSQVQARLIDSIEAFSFRKGGHYSEFSHHLAALHMPSHHKENTPGGQLHFYAVG